MSDAFLEISDLGRVFKVGHNQVKALDGVSITVAKGDTLAVVGESGSGKTTLANILLGIDAATRGQVRLHGEELPKKRSGALLRKIGLVQQNPYTTLNPRKSIGQSVALPLAVHRIGRRTDRRDHVMMLLERVGLRPDLQDRKPLALSGGQRQRVAIARALTTQPEILVLDEPTSALDVSVQAHILHLLRDLQREFGLTYVFITHDLSVVRVLANRVAVMYRGRIVEEGPVEKVFFSPRHRYTQQLLASIPTVSEEDDRLKPDWPVDAGLDRTSVFVSEGCPFRPRCPFSIADCAATEPVLRPDASDTHVGHLHSCLNPLQRERSPVAQ
jgi:peptide/nickel transport system ATP-binding protein/oligopeptide transport system ATP-binding protein